MLLPRYRGLLVVAVWQADPAIISTELLKQWYRVKMHRIPIRWYLSCSLGLAWEEIKLGTEFQLKQDPTWLWSSQELQSSNKKGSTIVITVGSLEEAWNLLVNEIHFGGSQYRMKHYWEVRMDTVCPWCCHLGHCSFRACRDHQSHCFICAGSHEGNKHACQVVDCLSKPETVCQHISTKCGNCSGPHPAIAGNCPAKQEARKQLMKRNDKAVAQQTPDIPQPEERVVLRSSQELIISSFPEFQFTVVNQGSSNSQAWSSSVSASPQTPWATCQTEDMEMRDTSILSKPNIQQC